MYALYACVFIALIQCAQYAFSYIYISLYYKSVLFCWFYLFIYLFIFLCSNHSVWDSTKIWHIYREKESGKFFQWTISANATGMKGEGAERLVKTKVFEYLTFKTHTKIIWAIWAWEWTCTFYSTPFLLKLMSSTMVFGWFRLAKVFFFFWYASVCVCCRMLLGQRL